MANTRIAMFQIRRLIELRLQGVSKRNMARILAMSRNTVQQYLAQLEAHFPDLATLLDWDEAQLDRLLTAPITPPLRHPELIALFPSYEQELARPGVTRQQLWLEYRQQYPNGVRYSQFNTLLRAWQRSQKVVMHLEHKAAEQLFIDFAGDKLELTDQTSGQKRGVDVFVAILPCSQLTYVQAVNSQRQEDFIEALQNCLSTIGGVPQAIVPDNLKSAVARADRYEPTINQSLQDFASHYQTVIFPARARKPRDKALVENAVRLIYQRVYAPLRNQTFYSLSSLNEAIGRLVDQHNCTPLQAKAYSRRQRFEQVEKDLLASLPTQPYQLRHYAQARVNQNGHVQLVADKHYYSVPYPLIGKVLKLIYSQQTVEVYHHYERVAVHQRQTTPGQYTTLRAHLHPRHQWLSQHSPLFFCEQASQIGSFTHQLVEQLLATHRYAPQAYRSCSGILSLVKKYGNHRLERACQRALHFQAINYRFVRTILERDMDRLELDAQPVVIPQPVSTHENIRGAKAYQ